MLRVPTYFNFQKYYFVDVLNMLSRYVCETDFLKERISHVKTLIKQTGTNPITNNEEAFDDMYAHLLSSFRVVNIEQLGTQHKISMVEDLRKTRVRVMKKVVQNIDSLEGNVFDSSHVIFTPRLQKHFRAFLVNLRCPDNLYRKK